MRNKSNFKETKPRVEFTMFCNNCANETKHIKLFSYLHPDTIEYFSKNSDGSVKDSFWSIHILTYIFAECLGCETPSVSIDEYFPDNIDSIGIRAFAKEIEDKGKSEKYNILSHMQFPHKQIKPLPKWCKELPETLMLLIVETYNAFNMDSNCLAIMGVRAIIDELANIKVGDIGGFDKKLDSLKELGHISTLQYELLNTVIDAGNASVHRGYRPSTEDVMSCLDVIEHILSQDVILKAIKRVKDNTPKRKKL